jgi:nucleotide-binding universal stress UspA family protein
MSVIVNQVDTNSNMATVAVVDKYGELVAHQSFFKLMQPRKLKGNRGAGGEVNEEERRRQAKLENAIQEEQKDHDADREKIKTLIRNHNVDLIVVGANKLEGRSVKKTLTEICEQLKTH